MSHFKVITPQRGGREGWACRTHEGRGRHIAFLSHVTSTDHAVAVHLYHTLHRYGIIAFASGVCLPLGTNHEALFVHALSGAEIVVLCVSEASLASLSSAHITPSPVLTEYEMALAMASQGEAVVIPVFLGRKAPGGYVPFDRRKCPAFAEAPSAHPGSQGGTVKQIITQILDLKGIHLVDTEHSQQIAHVVQDVILEFKRKYPQNLISPVLELPWGVVPRVQTESGAASGLPLPGLFVSSPPPSSSASKRGSAEPISLADDLAPIEDIKNFSVDTVIKDFCAETSITQTYFCDRNAHAVYLFPIDEMATLVDFSVRVGGELLTGRVVEQLDTSARYEEVVARGSAASILENLQADVYAIQIGEISERTAVEVTVVYNTLLPVDGQSVCYVLPMALAPRPITASDEDAEKAEAGMSDIDRMLQVRKESQKDTLRIKVNCKMSNTVKEIRSPSHDKINIQLAHQRAPIVELVLDQPYLDNDFVLLIKTESPNEPRAFVELSEQGDSSCAAIAYNPPAPTNPPKSLSADIVFVVQHGPSIVRQARQIIDVMEKMLNLLPDLCEDIHFNIGCFGSDSRLLWTSSQPYCPESVEKAHEFLQHHVTAPADPDAGKVYAPEDLVAPLANHRALLSLLRKVSESQPAGSSQTRQFLLLSNGNIRDRHGYLAKDVAEAASHARVFTVGLGYAVGRKLLTGIAKETGAAFFSILPHTQGVSAIKTSLFNAVAEPSHVQVLWEFPDSAPVPAEDSEASKQVPFRPRPIFYGQPTVIYNLPNNGSKPIQNVILVASRTPGGPQEETVLHGWPQHGSRGFLLQRLAAQTLIQELEDGTSYLQQQGSPSDGEVKQAILDLALKYHLHSPYTTWEVVSSKSAPKAQPGRLPNGGSDPALKPPIKSVSKLKLVTHEPNEEALDRLDRARQPDKTPVDEEHPSFGLRQPSVPNVAVPPPQAPQSEAPRRPSLSADRAAAIAEAERLREIHAREQEKKRKLLEAEERERRDREAEQRKRQASEEALIRQQFAEEERRLHEAREREAEALRKARVADEERLAQLHKAEERRREDLERQARETRLAAEQLKLQRENEEQAAALRRLEEERRIAEANLATARERRERELAQRREEEAAQQKRRDEERERALQALMEARRRQEEEEQAALERTFQTQRESIKRATQSRADDALRATEDQILQETRRRAAEREKERLRNEEEAARLRRNAEALRNSSQTLRSSTLLETTASRVSSSLGGHGAAGGIGTFPTLSRGRSEFRDSLIDWKLESSRAETQRHLRGEFDLHEQQLARKIHDFDEETRRLRRELLTDVPTIRDVSEYKFKTTTISNDLGSNVRSVHTDIATSNIVSQVHVTAQEEAARLEAERLLAATRNSVDEAKRWTTTRKKNTVSYETLYCPECERESTLSRHHLHRSTRKSTVERSSVRLQKKTIRYEIDLEGWQGEQFMSPVGPPGWRHFPVFVHKTHASDKFGLYGPAWLQITPKSVALLTQREGDTLWQVPIESIGRFGHQGRSILVDVKDNDYDLGGVYKFESPRFETIVDVLKSHLA